MIPRMNLLSSRRGAQEARDTMPPFSISLLGKSRIARPHHNFTFVGRPKFIDESRIFKGPKHLSPPDTRKAYVRQDSEAVIQRTKMRQIECFGQSWLRKARILAS